MLQRQFKLLILFLLQRRLLLSIYSIIDAQTLMGLCYALAGF